VITIPVTEMASRIIVPIATIKVLMNLLNPPTFRLFHMITEGSGASFTESQRSGAML